MPEGEPGGEQRVPGGENTPVPGGCPRFDDGHGAGPPCRLGDQGGAVVVEQVFSIPGIGRQVLLGIQQKEYALVQSTVLVIALAFVIVNLLTDLLYRAIDPRVRAA